MHAAFWLEQILAEVIFTGVGIKMVLINHDGLPGDINCCFVLLDGLEVELDPLFRPIDEFIQALSLGNGIRGGWASLDEDVELGLNLSTIFVEILNS